MEIRTAVRADLAALALCEARAFGWPERPVEGDGARSHSRLLSEIANGQIEVATDAGRAVAFISCARTFDHLFVSVIGVLPEYQRRGLGDLLLAAAESEAARLGLSHVSLFDDGTEPHTLAFYRKRGYRETDRCEGAGFTRVYLSKPLSPGTAAAA
jgi:ribosomal protein S18 acetylase RimI-like enzyme